ncbi:hypothetical protein L596_013081 [Steinernema carpocapsae]|uniref:Uncharacterized protein n=1 Tax=Steinernema carpocapsae TaxID=34508 RepID=A0A4U5NZ22_STECR|nr:hypothetical protein L596_013081 [Steinernema carpocapsae]
MSGNRGTTGRFRVIYMPLPLACALTLLFKPTNDEKSVNANSGATVTRACSIKDTASRNFVRNEPTDTS